ncbi:MAG: DUF2141 domain-containing protein, partial [Bacteroidota bacterium]|nr:DUF2141 domain-containing protein [Bacteroidota bacterium]
MRNKGIISLLILILMAVSINAQTLTVEITNIRNDKGNISLAVFIDNSSFVKEIPFLAKTYSKTNLIDEKLIVKINLKPGVYGISVLDDENKNGEMEYNLIGVPKEGFG